nr:retrovirus-related Pol polyprotein from transposon TNT 1-94 [Tanacetum cinerariifolium]
MDLQDKGVIDSGCSRNMTRNMSYLIDYEKVDGGYVAFGGNPKGGKITRKEAVNTTCYVQNRVLAVEPHNKTPYELFHGRTPTLSFMRPFGSSHDDGFKPSSDNGKKVNEDPRQKSECNDQEKQDNVNSTNIVNAASTNEVNAVGENISSKLPFDPTMPALEDIGIFDFSNKDKDDDAVADKNNLDTTIQVSPALTIRIHKDHPLDQVIGDLHLANQTRNMSKNLEEHRKRAIRTKWVFIKKMDKRGIVIRNKARLVAQGHTQEEGIDCYKVVSLVARIEAIRLFLAYASFKDFVVYQIDVKSAFLYGKIKEEMYVCQPPGFEDPDFPDRVYKVKKALYGLHQAPRAWYETLSTYLLDNGFQRGKFNKTLFIKRHKDDSMGELTFFLGLQVKQKNDGIFICQDKYIAEILKKFGFTEVKNASTPMETQKPLLKDEDGEEVGVHMYRVDGKEIIISESSVQRDLRLADEDGVDCLPNSTIFTNLEMMGKPKRKNTQVSQPSDSTEHVADEAIHKERDDILVRAAVKPRIKGEELTQECSKKQKVDDEKEMSKLKELMEIILNEKDVAIDAIPLAVKEDLEDLYNLVKAKYGSRRPVEDLDLLLRGDLKNMFEPHVEDQVWKKQHGYIVLEWKLYEFCGVHSLRMKFVHIYMLVEKKYPLTALTLIDMLNKKLQDDHLTEMKTRKHFAAKAIEEKRNKPPTQAQQRKIMCTYLKNIEGKKLKDLKNKSFDFIQKMFNRDFNRVNTFVDFRTELVEGSLKRAGEEITQESAKKQKVDDEKETTELKQLMKIIPDEEKVAINVIPLAVKSPKIVDWKIHKDGKKAIIKL